MLNDTIVAQATPIGAGALAVVRLSGPEAVQIAARIFRPSRALLGLPSRTNTTGRIVDGARAIDQVVATVFRAPRSYTGEDVVEITCHGGPVVITRLVSLLVRAGARSARAGEFTQRAFANGKMDLAQAEAVAALIAARSSAGAEAALNVLRGALSQTLTASMTALTGARVLIESSLDIQEDGAADVLVPALEGEATSPEETAERVLKGEEERLASLLEGSRAGRLLEEGARVVLIGRPNAGKSSLFNALLARERAIVSPEPGTTRDALEAWVEWDGMAIALLDTAGLGRADGDVERESMRRAREAAEAATLAVLVVDAGAEPVAELETQVRSSAVAPQKLLIALHKWDLDPAEPWRRLAERGVLVVPGQNTAGPGGATEIPVLRTSAVAEPGTRALRRCVAAQLTAGAAFPAEVAVVGQRQRDLLERAHAAVARARGLLQRAEGGELVAFELRAAHESVAELLGRRADPMLLEAIFSRFCVGK